MNLTGLVVLALACGLAAAEEKPKTGPPPSSTAASIPTSTTQEPSPTTTGSTSTTAPAPTTPAPPTPPAPTTPPRPETPPKGLWNVTDGNTTCLMVQMGVRYTFLYNNGSDDIKGYVDLPVDETISSGNCTSDTETLTLEFNGNWSMTWTFEKSGNDWRMTESSVSYTLTKALFPDISHTSSDTARLVNLTKYDTKEDTSYECRKEDVLDFKSLKKALQEVDTYELKVQAGNKNPGPLTFSTDASVCPQDTDVSNIVPIVVGAALAALVLVVLIAYLVGRKRNRRGYESV